MSMHKSWTRASTTPTHTRTDTLYSIPTRTACCLQQLSVRCDQVGSTHLYPFALPWWPNNKLRKAADVCVRCDQLDLPQPRWPNNNSRQMTHSPPCLLPFPKPLLHPRVIGAPSNGWLLPQRTPQLKASFTRSTILGSRGVPNPIYSSCLILPGSSLAIRYFWN